MAVTSATVSVGTTATLLASTPDSDNSGQDFLVTNNGSSTLYVGDASVTTSSGTPVAAAAAIGLSLQRAEKLYGVVASGTVDARVLTIGGTS